MKASILLRIASALALLELGGHTWLFLSYTPKHGPAEAAVIDAMKSQTFSFSGFQHTYWDLYTGYGLFVSVSLLIEIGLLWRLASLVRDETQGMRSFVAILALGEAGYAALMCRYFFLIPIASHFSMCFLLAAAIWFMRSADRVPSFPSVVQRRESQAR
jgi:hypothetical protein